MNPTDGYLNPVLRGFHPDPTACRVGDWYYLAVSSFLYFPGIPLYRSRDLVHWEAVGHALTKPSQLPPSEQAHSEGIFAPTLRHDGSRFYLITTNVQGCGNFVVTAESFEGPWSDPLVLDDAPGIDPSLYFEDGRAWITGTAEVPEGARYYGNNEIWLREWSPATGKWIGPRGGLWRGAVRDAVWPEGPHLYKKNGWYYLLISEGGTADDHAISVARSRTIEGPYVGHKKNPIMTHRHLGKGAKVINVGHPDLVDAADGTWWMVLLASRPHHAGGTNRGRETFLAPVTWEDDWPVVSAGTGQLQLRYEHGPALASPMVLDPTGGFDGFEGDRVLPAWQFLRCADTELHSLTERKSWLRLKGTAAAPGSLKPVAWIGRRILHEYWSVRCRLQAESAQKGLKAGLCILQNDSHRLQLEAQVTASGVELRLIVCSGGAEQVVAQQKLDTMPEFLEISCEGHQYAGRWSQDASKWNELAKEVSGTYLTTEAAGGFVGCMVGPYAVGGIADFDWVDLRGYDES